jgi:hypothetical protein
VEEPVFSIFRDGDSRLLSNILHVITFYKAVILIIFLYSLTPSAEEATVDHQYRFSSGRLTVIQA